MIVDLPELGFLSVFRSPVFYQIFHFLYVTSPVWLPIMLGGGFVAIWLNYIRTDFIIKQGSVLLELKLPKEVFRSPKGMELVFTQLYQTGGATEIDTFWYGKIRPWWSVELYSYEGQIHFYVWAFEKWKNMIEAQLYAQYPGIEIYEVDDYTKGMYHDPSGKEMFMWGTHFKKTGPDPFPIMTYVDYKLDDPNTEEESKIDPFTTVLEYLGSLKKGEQVWIQIIFQAHKEEKFADGRVIPKKDWKERGLKEIENIRKAATPPQPEGSLFPGFPNPTKGQVESISSIERNINKFPFECCMRGIYFAKAGAFDSVNINGLIGSVRQYSSNTGNGLKFTKWTDFDYPWQDWHRMRRNHLERSFLKAYKMRSYFNPPYKHWKVNPFILTTEELATIFHIPGKVAVTPTIQRVEAKKAEAPANLPT